MTPRPPRRTAIPAAFALGVFVALFAPGPARADWLPLDIGNQWRYMDEADDPHLEEITDPIHVRGRHMVVKSYSGGVDDGLINFWMLDTDGSVLLGGYYRAIVPFGLVYEPPVKVFPGAPSVGLGWYQHTRAIAIPDNVTYGEFDTWWQVQGHMTIVNQAGSFDAFGAGQVAPPDPSAAPGLVVSQQGQVLALDGRVVRPRTGTSAAGPESSFDWYANDVGLVQYSAGKLYQLVSYLLPTPAAPSSWGRIKSLYR